MDHLTASGPAAATYADVSLMSDGVHVGPRGQVVPLAPAEVQLMSSLVKAQGRTVRRTVLEMAAWGIWGTVTPDALDTAINRVRAKLALLGSKVRITGAAGHGYALSRS